MSFIARASSAARRACTARRRRSRRQMGRGRRRPDPGDHRHGAAFGYRLDGDIIQPRVALAGPKVTGGGPRSMDARDGTGPRGRVGKRSGDHLRDHQHRCGLRSTLPDSLATSCGECGGSLAARRRHARPRRQAPRDPVYPSGWRYFDGLGQFAQPQWTADEGTAEPLVLSGSPPAGSGIDPMRYHRCFGYFSVRYLEAAGKWVMLYTCDNLENPPLRTTTRGVFLRTATVPWGAWSWPMRSSIRHRLLPVHVPRLLRQRASRRGREAEGGFDGARGCRGVRAVPAALPIRKARLRRRGGSLHT